MEGPDGDAQRRPPGYGRGHGQPSGSRRACATSARASRSSWSPATTAIRQGVTARRVAVRRPLEQGHLADHGPGAELGDRLAVDLDPEHAVEQEVDVGAGVALLDQGLAGLQAPERALPSMMATDSRRSRAVSAATTSAGESSSPQGVRCSSVSRNQRSKSIRPVLATSVPLVVVDPVPGERAGPDDLVGGPAVGVDGEGRVDQAAGAIHWTNGGRRMLRRRRAGAAAGRLHEPDPAVAELGAWGARPGRPMAAKVRSREPRRRVVLPIRPPPAWPWSTMRPSSTSIQARRWLANRKRSPALRASRSSSVSGARVVVGDAEAEGQLRAGAFHRPERDP